ncbi:subclass B3 metallo-beta-lactamase [Sphingomonas bacterium]|uniref:subclass B3 metallo-beta-lactamase n=1 Tax=Sphingomonas bacterium TaxID=1895847 RepID=UPI002610E5CE|nr:subclass B3 metallo-beta-lactamase [Sphingomonas bacterium]MDB5680070.1 beta-lactamase [Sphingomonas bacterium]
MIAKLVAATAAFLLLGAAAPQATRFPAPPRAALPVPPVPAAWTMPHAPFRITGNIYYVGTEGLSAYLIATPKGLILLDATMEANVPGIEANIRSLGFKLSDVKILLNSHAHFDHAGGLAMMKRDTGATLAAMRGDVWALENGRHDSDQNYRATFAPVKVDRVLKSGDTVSLGGVTLTAIATPGHTKGCTTWLMTTRTEWGMKRVIFPGSLTVAGSKLVGNRQYPGIAADFRRSFDRMAVLKADIVLPAHPELAGVTTRKGAELLQPGLLAKLVVGARGAFEQQWLKESAIAR